MKKIKLLSFIVVFSLLLCLMLTPVCAKSDEVFVSSDYSELEYNGQKYVRVSENAISAIANTSYTEDVEIENGNSLVNYCSCEINDSAASLWISYSSGGSATYYYIKDSLVSEFNAYAQNGGSDILTAPLYNQEISAGRSLFFGAEQVISGFELNYYTFECSVFSLVFNGDVRIDSGYLISDSDGGYYYVDYIKSSDGSSSSLDMQKKVKIWRITNDELITEIDDAVNNGYPGGDLGYYDESSAFAAGIFLLIIILGIIPLVGAIVFFCASFKCDKEYKIRLRIISALCLLATVITIITVIVCISLI